MARLMRASV